MAEPVPRGSAKRSDSLSWGERAKARRVSPPRETWFGRLDKPSFLVGAGMSALAALLAVVMFSMAPMNRRSSQAAEAPAPEPPAFQIAVAPLVKKYCGECHGGQEPEGGIAYSKYADEAAMLKDRKTWERTFEMVNGGTMPPADSPQPTAEEKARFLDYLEGALYRIDCTKVSDPGRVTIRRLNRAEYNNTVRDLLGVTVRPADDFPSDDVGYGFDNIGDVLSLPPLLMEKYLDAAEKIATQAIIVSDPNPKVREFSRRELKRSRVAQSHGDSGVILVSVGDISLEFDFPRSGEYILRAKAAETPAGPEHARMEYRLDGDVLKTFDVQAVEANPENCEFKFKTTKGNHRLSIKFLNDFYDEKEPDKGRRDRNLILHDVEIAGPLSIEPSELPAAHKTLLAVRPGDDKSTTAAARDDLKPFLRRAFRRPVADAEIDRYAGFVDAAVKRNEPFEFGMQVALTAVLVSPHFLYRIETDKRPDDPADRHALNDFELASRLSYFLWSSMPDDQLLAQAEQGDLHHDAVLDEQVRRMLKDPRSQALVDNFAEQWLQLRILNEVTPDPEKFPEFTAQLREDMKQETRRFFEYVMREDRSILEFLDGRYTFVNARLAKHYGLPEVGGDAFQKVGLDDQKRAGLLTQGSILALTSNPDRTSPVKRGKWVMEVILDQPPPPPPPNVPELDEAAKAAPEATLRQQLELHRQNATCNSCHRVMDQLGFGMENFDAIGRWREQDNGKPLDTTGELPGGARFAGPVELAHVLRGKQCEFSDCLTEKMLTYALGRGLEFYDRCATDKIVKTLKDQQFRFSVLVAEITKSEPFRMRRGEEAQ